MKKTYMTPKVDVINVALTPLMEPSLTINTTGMGDGNDLAKDFDEEDGDWGTVWEE